jgi:NAD+ kinase
VKLVGIVRKNKSRRAVKASNVLIDYLKSISVDYFVIHSRHDAMEKSLQDLIPKCDLSVTFGGDGTLLYAARVFSRYNVPIVGINLGGLGFITEFKEAEVLECVECFMNGFHSFEERMMIDVNVFRKDKIFSTSTGLNDLVISSGGISRLLEFEVSCNTALIGIYRADGIIVSTPTGSTAYSLAAGGPVLDPTMNALIISPICSHSLGARPLVVPSGDIVRVKVLSKNRAVTATVDGQIGIELRDGDEIRVLRSKTLTKLVSVGKRSFYDIIREKLAWKG